MLYRSLVSLGAAAALRSVPPHLHQQQHFVRRTSTLSAFFRPPQQPNPSSQVQRVYELALDGDLDGALQAMEDVTADMAAMIPDAGVGSEPGGPICYQHIHTDSSLSMSIFVLPAGACIPLHDHPSMTVLSKLLFGSLRVTSYDMPAGGSARQIHCAPASQRTVSAPCAPLRLDAVDGNIHSFEALSHTAIFDVLAPPYNDLSGRSCNYYVEEGEAAGDGQMVLRQVPWPKTLKIVNRPYAGEPVAPRSRLW